MNATSCPTREVLLAYHTGELPEASADSVIAHLAHCPACQATVRTFGEAEDSLIAHLRRAPAQESGSQEPQCREFIERAKAIVPMGGVEESPPGHPSKEQLAAYARGKLGGSAAGVLARHVEQCPSCEATLSNMASEAGTSIGRSQGRTAQPPQPDEPSGPTKPQPQDLAPTELFGGSDSPGAAVPTQLREYRILEKLGAGGMGTVYKALHTKLDKVVALKILPAAAMEDAELVARFEREMKAVGKLGHPNIVRAMDAGCHEGIHFLVMEYVEGMDLAEVVRRCGPLRIADACEVIRQAALGLRHADEHALVHRDVKPSNLVLSAEGEVKILDLGLALLQTDQMAEEEATGRGRTMGTLDYMAPEQVRDSHSVDIRADIYSLGCTFYRLLTGQPPFSGPQYEKTFDKMMAHLNEPFPPVRPQRPDVPEKVAAVLERMVAKDRDKRYAKPGQLVEELRPFCPGCDLVGVLARALNAPGAHPRVAASPAAPAKASGGSPDAGAALGAGLPAALGAGLPPALGAGLPTPPRRPTARSPESATGKPEVRGLGRPIGPGEGEVRRPSPSAEGEGEVRRPSPSAEGEGEVRRPSPNAPGPQRPSPSPQRPAPGPQRPAPSASVPPRASAEESFDPYRKWFGIPAEEQPPNHYRLLGIPLFEEDRDVIQSAAAGRSAHLKNMVLGKHQAESQRLLNEVQLAKICLLTPEDKVAYDAQLRQELQAKKVPPPPPPTPPALEQPAAAADPLAFLETPPAASKKRPGGKWGRRKPSLPVLIGTAAAAAVVLLGVIVYVVTGKGTVKIELSDPTAEVEVKIDGNQIDVRGLENPLELRVGNHDLEVTAERIKTVTKSFVVTRGKEEVLRITLEAAGPGVIENVRRTDVLSGGLMPPSPLKYLGYSVYGPSTVIEEIAPYTNVVFDSGWLEKGSGVVERAGQMRLPVILAIPPKMREGIEEKLFPFIEKHRDVVMGVGWRSPYYQGYLAEHVEEFGRALKARFPGLQYWVTNVSKPRGKHETQPIPDSVDVIVVDDYFSTTPDKLLQGTADYLPGWLWKARGRPVLLEWTSWEAKPTRIVDRIDPATMRACFDIAKEYRLAGLLFWKYGPETDTANEGTPGLESSLGLVKEIQQGAEEVGVVKQRASLRASAKSGSTTPPAVQTPATTAPPLAIAPFDEKKAKEHQEAWAKHLGVPVEITNSIGMKLVLIPPGEFDMGSTDDEIARLVDEAKHRKLATWVLRTLPSETPRHRVRISRAFYLGQYEVTQDQFRRMMSYNPSKNKGSGTEAPVEEISWGEAVAFCGQLSELAVEKSAGGAYRLTTEAEWEYACRAGTTTAYCFGDDEAGVSEFAWWQQNADERTHPVGEKRPNHFGLYDMHGNVAEWCSDWYSSDYYSQSPDVDPTGPAAGENRVLRGLSYRDPHPLLLRSACRIWRSPASRFHHYGFRVVKTITP